MFASAAAAEGASKDDWAPAAALLGLPAIQVNAYYLHRVEGGRHVLLIGNKEGQSCGFRIGKGSNVKPTVYWGKAVLVSYERATRANIPMSTREMVPAPAHLKPAMPAIKWVTGEDHTLFSNAPGGAWGFANDDGVLEFGLGIKSVSCARCHQPSVLRRQCGRCLSLYYCNKECQLADWPRHRSSCCTE